jgi:hypothetical protein
LQSNIQELTVEEDTIWNEIPKPITQGSEKNKSEMRTCDLKKGNYFNEDNKHSAVGSKKFVSDVEANKFVNNILQSKLNFNN